MCSCGVGGLFRADHFSAASQTLTPALLLANSKAMANCDKVLSLTISS